MSSVVIIPLLKRYFSIYFVRVLLLPIHIQYFCHVLSRLTLWFISFFTVIIQAILVLLCLFLVVDIVQEITVQVKGSLRFLNTTNLYRNKKKCFSFVFDAATVWNDLPDDVRSVPTRACFRKKLKS